MTPGDFDPEYNFFRCRIDEDFLHIMYDSVLNNPTNFQVGANYFNPFPIFGLISPDYFVL